MAEQDGSDGNAIALLQGVRAFNKEAAPAFLDHAAMIAGFAPPPGSPVGEGQGAGFAWCELHCGSAVTACLLAGSNPLGDFHGIDAREALIDEGRALAADGGVRNLTLHRAGLEQALDLSLPGFDYIVISGVYSWVPMRERALVLAFLRKFLKPGGIAYITYNARPGWNRLDVFRRLYRDATRGADADPHRRLAQARALYGALEQAKAPALLASGVTASSLKELESVPADALAADYANDFSEPLYVSEVAADMAAIDCVLAGPAEMGQTAGALMAHEPFKSTLAVAANPIARELAKDILLDTRFRRDVFVRGGQRLSADNREMMMNGLAFALERPAEDIRFRVPMPFGMMAFDTPQVRAVIAALRTSPRTLGEMLANTQPDAAGAQELVAALHTLLATGQIRPVYRATRESAAAASRLQAAIQARAATPGAIGFLPSGFGTGFLVPVADQIFAARASDTGADARAARVIDLPGGGALPQNAREDIGRRARAFKRMQEHYAALGINFQ